MAYDAQNLNVCGVGSKTWLRAVRFYVMSLQRLCAAAFFTATFFCNNLFYQLSNSIGSLRRAIVPFWVVRAAHVAATGSCQTWNRTISTGSPMAFSNLKRLATFFAHAVKQSFGATRFKFVRARPGASVCFSSHMRVGASKLSTTSGASKCYMSTPFDLSLEF